MISYKNLINKFTNIKLVNNTFKKFRNKFIILYYHGVIEDNDMKKINGPNKHLFVPKSYFIEQMSFLEKNNINVISINELCKLNFKPSKFSVILSFDDGYKDNIDIVYPILKEKNFPFIIYLVPKLLNEEPWVWWLELWNQLNKKNEIYIEKIKTNIDSNFLKKKAFFKIKKKMKLLKISDQKEMIKKIFNISKIENMSNHFLDQNEIKILINDKLVTIGSHSYDHLSLKNFDKKNIIEQIEKSKEYLEKTFNIPIKHFSYPYGQSEDIAYYEHEILSKLGFLTGVTTLDYSYKKFNQYYLNRCSIGPNVRTADFRRKLLGVDQLLRKFFLR